MKTKWIKKCVTVTDDAVYVLLHHSKTGEEHTVILDLDNEYLSETITIKAGYVYRLRPYKSLANEVLGVSTSTKKYVDHINGNTFDNRRCNLRVCTPSQNGRNRHVHSRSNTSIVGIVERYNGTYHYYRAQYTDLAGKRCVKQFNINKLGAEKALEEAKIWLDTNRKVNDYLITLGSETIRKE